MEEVSEGWVEVTTFNENKLKELNLKEKTFKCLIKWDCDSDVRALNGMSLN
jgi:hypothetical protein